MGWWYFLSIVAEVGLALLCVGAAYVQWDVYNRKKVFEAQGLTVMHQMFHFSNLFVNLLPRSGLARWFFPYRMMMFDENLSGTFAQAKSNVVAFVSYKFQEVFTNDPKLVKDITVTRRKEFPKPFEPYAILRLFGENVVTAVDEEGEWKKHRAIVGPAFSEGNNATVADATVLNLNLIMDGWRKDVKDGKVAVDVDAEMVRLALSVIGLAGLGLDLSKAIYPVPAKDGVMHKLSLRDALQNVCKYLLPRLIIPTPLSKIPFGTFKEIKTAFDEFKIYMKDFCEERTKFSSNDETSAESLQNFEYENEEEKRKETKRGDLLSKLLQNNTVLTTDEIFGDIFIFLVAGHETTAHTLSWAIRLLALHPDKQQKLYEEVVSVLGDRDPTYEDYENLVYARSVFRETLRLFPQVPGVVKWNEGGSHLGPYTLPPKTMYALAVPALHMNPEYWDEPNEFRPDRFDHRLPGYVAPDPYLYIPFATGRRGCLGAKFAQVEGTLALSMLVKEWKIDLPAGVTDPKYVFDRVILLTASPKHQLHFVMSKRKPAASS